MATLHAAFLLPWLASLPGVLPWLLTVGILGWLAYTRLFHPLARVPGPFLASLTRLWYVRKVQHGSFDKLNRELHATYGK